MKETTKNLYLTNYNKLLKNGFNPSMSFNALKKILDSFKIKESTKNNYYKSLLYINKEQKILNDDFYNSIQTEIKKINNRAFQKTIKGLLNEQQKKNYLSWNEILKTFEQIKTDEKNQLKILLVALYVLFPVRRVLDYQKMIYTTKKPKQKKEDNNNYFVDIKKPYFIFNNYKTKTTYKQQIFIINNDELINIIRDYVNNEKIKNNDLLINLNHNAFIAKLRNLFYKYTKKFISVNILRHSYISYMTNSQKLNIPYDRHQLALSMGHSLYTNLNYYIDEKNL